MSERAEAPLIDHVILGGLKAYGPDPVRVELAPITLVFGPNSAGKSSLLSTLTLLRQTLASDDPTHLRLRGDLVDVGSYRLAVHGHDESQRMTLGISFSAPGEVSGFVPGDVQREIVQEFGFDPETGTAPVRTLRLRLGEAAAEFPLAPDGTYPDVVEETPGAWVDNLMAMADRAGVGGGNSMYVRPMVAREGAAEAVASGDRVAAAGMQFAIQLQNEFSDVLSRVAYIGPMRAQPDRTAMLSTVAYRYVGPSGEHTTEVLSDHDWLVDAVNEWMGRLGIGYQVQILVPVSEQVIMTAGDFAVLGLLDVREDPPVLVSSRAVGFGISQVTPIVVQSLLSERGVLLIEQPEVHIHPRLQSAIGDLLIHSVQERGNQMLIETHSEHLVLRLLRRVREGVLHPDDLAILYVDTLADGGAHVRRLEVDADGDLIEGWPGGFFDERLNEVLGRD